MRAVHLRIAWIIVLALLRIGGATLCLCFLALTSVLRLLPAMSGSDDGEDLENNTFETSQSDDAYDSLTSFTARRTNIF